MPNKPDQPESTSPPSTEESPSMAFSSYGTTTLPQTQSDVGVAMPQFITDIMRGLFATFSDYITLIVIVAGIFAVGNVIELDYFRYNIRDVRDDSLVVYSLVLSGVFGVGIYVLMHGLSISTPKVTTGMALGVVIAYGVISVIVSFLDEVFFADSLFTNNIIGSAEFFGQNYIVNNIWAVRAVQAGIIVFLVSELTAGAFSRDETRLNVGLMIVLFVGLVGVSFGYSELMERLMDVDIETATEARLIVAGGGAVRGAGLALLFLITFKTAYNAKVTYDPKPKQY